MEQEMLRKMLRMLDASTDTDAVMGLRAVQGHFAEKGVTLEQALLYADMNAAGIAAANKGRTIDQAAAPAPRKAAPPPVAAAGMPQCRMPAEGCIEIIPAGKASGEVIQLPGAAAGQAEKIAMNFKDAITAAVLNKARFKLKLNDVKNGRGDILETVLQAEYDREGMTPVPVWSNVRGEVAALATVLRRAVSTHMADLAA